VILRAHFPARRIGASTDPALRATSAPEEEGRLRPPLFDAKALVFAFFLLLRDAFDQAIFAASRAASPM
jgi:hypothetical protein